MERGTRGGCSFMRGIQVVDGTFTSIYNIFRLEIYFMGFFLKVGMIHISTRQI